MNYKMKKIDFKTKFNKIEIDGKKKLMILCSNGRNKGPSIKKRSTIIDNRFQS